MGLMFEWRFANFPFWDICCVLQASQRFSEVFEARTSLAPESHFMSLPPSRQSMSVGLPSPTKAQVQLLGREGSAGLMALEASGRLPLLPLLEACFAFCFGLLRLGLPKDAPQHPVLLKLFISDSAPQHLVVLNPSPLAELEHMHAQVQRTL